MPRPRMKIKTIREILRLDSMNFSTREIGRSVGKGSSSVNDGVFQGSCRVLSVIRPNDYLQ